MDESKFEPEFKRTIAELDEHEFVTALLYPQRYGAELQAYLDEQIKLGTLKSYNYLRLALCVAVNANRPFYYNIATRSDIRRISSNPTFTKD